MYLSVPVLEALRLYQRALGNPYEEKYRSRVLVAFINLSVGNTFGYAATQAVHTVLQRVKRGEDIELCKHHLGQLCRGNDAQFTEAEDRELIERLTAAPVTLPPDTQEGVV